MTTLKQNDAALRGRFEKTGDFFTVKDGVAYGWAIVCTDGGKNYWDLQDDHIPEDEMVAATLDFMKNSRVGSDQHTGDHIGDIVFGFPITKDARALGLESTKTGFLIGYVPQDKSHLDLIAKGERTGFSIGGSLFDWDDLEVGKIGKLARVQRGAAPVAKNSPDAGDVYVPGEVGTGKRKRKGKVYRRFKIDEISLVTKPAQEGATVGYVKGATIAKAYVPVAFTSSDAGHQHVVDPDEFDTDGKGCTSCAISTDGSWHTHEWLRGADGAITIADNAGHGHSTSAVAPAQPYDSTSGVKPDQVVASDDVRAPATITATPSGLATIPIAASAEKLTGDRAGRSVQSNKGHRTEPKMDTPEQIEITKLKAKLVEKDAKIDRLEKRLDLSDTERAYYKQLGSREAKDAFLAKSDSERAVEAKKSLDAMIEFTSSDGKVYYKHDDARMIALAKDADETKKSLVMEKALREKAEIEKQAGDVLGHAPGDDATHFAVVKALRSISDEKVRDAAFEMLKGLNSGIKKMSRSTGSTGPIEKQANAGDPIAKAESKLKNAVSAFQKARNLSSYELAFALATIEDDATREAYDEVAELRESVGLEDN